MQRIPLRLLFFKARPNVVKKILPPIESPQKLFEIQRRECQFFLIPTE